MQQLIQKQNLTDTVNDWGLNKASRDYKWRLLYQNITTQDSIKFFSEQMKKNYMPPQIKNKLLMRGAGGHDGGRVEVEIPGCGSMVLPDTYEPEKFERPETTTKIDPESLNVGEKVQKVATEDELHRQ